MARGRKPLDPEHGAMTDAERNKRRRAVLAAQAQTAIDRPNEAHDLPGIALVHALKAQLAAIDADPLSAPRMPAAATVAAIVRKYRLEAIPPLA